MYLTGPRRPISTSPAERPYIFEDETASEQAAALPDERTVPRSHDGSFVV
jgi:hypothetical protein